MQHSTALALRVPGEGEDAEGRSRAFHFPYPVAYDIQLQLMEELFRAIEEGRAGVFESPTGTGKTLSLLCSAFTWMALHRKRAQVGVVEKGVDDQDTEPDWVVAHDQAKQREALEARHAEFREKLRAIRQRAKDEKRPEGRTDKKRQRLDTDGDESDSDFLVGDYDEQKRTTKDAAPQVPFVSDEVRAMMAAFETSVEKDTAPDEEPATTPKVYYASRTHSQLSQLIHELKRTAFGQGAADDPVRTVALGSRKQMCINADVQRVGATFGTEAMNERCLELMESGKSKKRCAYLPAQDAAGEAKMNAFRDHALDLVQLGKAMHTCPYFGARKSLAQAELVTLPYNLLLQQDARDALALDLDDAVVIIDEAHNLIDTILATYSIELSQAHIEQAAFQVNAYLSRFSMRLKGSNEEHLRTLQVLLAALQAFCASRSPGSETLTTAQLVSKLGGTVDQINFLRLEHWLKDTRIARKVDKLWLREHAGEAPSRHSKIHAMHLVESFLLALGDRARNGKVLVHARREGEAVRVHLKYVLLNPADAFQPLLDAARCVVLAGGTMEPISEFQRQLFGQIPPERFVKHSCGHIVPKENILGAIVHAGPKGLPFEFTHGAWENMALLDELGNALSNYSNIIPHGMVVFFPSYGSLNSTFAHWKKTGILERIGKRKRVFQEPTHAQDVDRVLQGYAAAIASPSPDSPKGAILFAVVNAKLSEGINFQDDLARCVVMIGLPFPNAKSPELVERMEYMRKLDTRAKPDLGRELYLNLCMRAVNQSMGRAIRHRADYSTFLLLDRRFARSEIASRMPKWIAGQTSSHERFGSSISALAGFYRSKRN